MSAAAPTPAPSAPHNLRSIPGNVSWGLIPAGTPPALTIASGETVRIDTISQQGLTAGIDPVAFFGEAGIAAENVLDDVKAIYRQVAREPGAGSHVLTGPIYVEGARPGVEIDPVAFAAHRVGLLDGARKAVEEIALGAIGLLHPLLDQRDHQLVGHQLAAIHVRLRLASELGAGADLGAQHVAGGDLRDAVTLGQKLRLGSLAGPGQSKQDESHRRFPIATVRMPCSRPTLFGARLSSA